MRVGLSRAELKRLGFKWEMLPQPRIGLGCQILLVSPPVAKSEISWKGRFEDGRRRQVYARHFSKGWKFFQREKRYDRWEPLEHPPLEDWVELLDGIERRVQRRLIPIDEIQRIKQRIRELFPEAEL